MTAIEEAEELLDNHRRYFRDTHKKRRTLSLEGLYMPERQDIDYEEEPPPPASKPVDVKQAVDTEKAIIKLPMTYRLIIATESFYRFVLHNKRLFYATCRKNKINPRNWESDYRKAKLMLLNKLGRNR